MTTSTTLRDIVAQIPRERDLELLPDGDQWALDARCDDAFKLSRQVAEAPITSASDTAAKMALARLICDEGLCPPDDLGCYESLLARLVRNVAEHLEAMAPVKPHTGAVLLSATAAEQVRGALRGGYDAIARADTEAQGDLDAMADLVRALAQLGAGRAPS